MRRAVSIVTLLFASIATADQIAGYDASSGLLPTDLCWTEVGAAQAPPPTIVRGAMLLGPTTFNTTTYFYRDLAPFSSDDGASITASVKVDQSTWFEQGVKRTGFYLGLADSNGRWALLGISSDRVLLATLDNNPSDGTFRFNSTTGFHTYRLELLGSIATVLIDDVVVLTDDAGTGGGTNVAQFGDMSILGSSTTRTAWVKVEGVSDCNAADLNCSGHVDATDLGILLGAWGTADCSADINQDGSVDAIDLGLLLGAWG